MAGSTKKKAADVTKPGEAPPDASGRPIIVGHKPITDDPMVTPVASRPPTTSESQKITVSSVQPYEPKPEAAPLTAEASIQTHNAVIEPLTKTASSAKPVKSEGAVETSDTTSVNEQTAQEAAVVDAVVDQAAADRRSKNKVDDATAAQQAAIEKLIESKKYYLPIGRAKRARRRLRWLLVFLFVVVLGLAAADLAINAGIIKTTLRPPIKLLNN